MGKINVYDKIAMKKRENLKMKEIYAQIFI